MIAVCNTRDKLNAPGVCDIAVGRPSILGNPFKLGEDGTRDEVIGKYREWLGQKIEASDPVVMSEMRRIALAASQGEVRLFCWCAPKHCHGDVIKEVVERYLDTGTWSVR